MTVQAFQQRATSFVLERDLVYSERRPSSKHDIEAIRSAAFTVAEREPDRAIVAFSTAGKAV